MYPNQNQQMGYYPNGQPYGTSTPQGFYPNMPPGQNQPMQPMMQQMPTYPGQQMNYGMQYPNQTMTRDVQYANLPQQQGNMYPNQPMMGQYQQYYPNQAQQFPNQYYQPYNPQMNYYYQAQAAPQQQAQFSYYQSSCLGYNPWSIHAWLPPSEGQQNQSVQQNVYQVQAPQVPPGQNVYQMQEPQCAPGQNIYQMPAPQCAPGKNQVNVTHQQQQPMPMPVQHQPAPPPMPEFSIEQFQELRQHSDERSALSQLSEIGSDLTKLNKNSLKSQLRRACLICCNTYKTPKYSLGVGPLNDSITVAANHKFMGYNVFYLHNPKSTQFLEYLKIFFKETTEALTVYYTGHGAEVPDKNGDEADGFDEAMLFDDTYVVDDDLLEIIRKNHNGRAYTILLTDCCHSGTIWDLPSDIKKCKNLPGNIMSISASKDSQTSKQTNIKKSTQGLFTYYFWKIFRENPGTNIKRLAPLVTKQISKYKQEVEFYATRQDMLDRPLFLK